MDEENQQIVCLVPLKKHSISRLQKLIDCIYKEENIAQNLTLSVVITDDDHMRELNHKFRNIDKSTDVLAFSFKNSLHKKIDDNLLGDIYISLTKAKEQAKDYKVSLQNEIERLTAHGILHLLGYDHKNKQEEKEMNNKIEYYLDILKKLD